MMGPDQTLQASVFMFINSGSGSGLGNALIAQEIKRITFEMQTPPNRRMRVVHVNFVNMRNPKVRNEGFALLKQQQAEKECFSIVCGGDGSVVWVVIEMARFQIDFSLVPIGIVPLGTGNDFSQALNWGKENSNLLDDNYRYLKQAIRSWLGAAKERFDLWSVKAEVFEYGRLEKVENGQNRVLESKFYERTFCNYFSFGLDGKIGYSFDMHRTSSRWGNIAMYGMLGVVKAATKTKNLHELIASVEEITDEKGGVVQENGIKSLSRTRINQLYTSSQTEILQNPLVTGDYQNFLVLNINSFMGGVREIWSNAKWGSRNSSQSISTNPSYSDGKLEIIAFSSGVGMAMERTFGGFATRLMQGKGPYQISFNPYPDQPKHRTYLQIDGEFIRITHPKQISIRKSKLGMSGQILVLRNTGE